MAIFIGIGFSGLSAQTGPVAPPAVGTVATVAAMPVASAVFDSGAAWGGNAADIPLSGTTDAANGARIEVQIVRADTGGQVHPWTEVATAAGGAWSGAFPAVPRSVHWLRAEVRVQGSAGPAGAMAGRFGVGHVWSIWEQSNWTRLLSVSGVYSIAPETVTHSDDVQIWLTSRPSGTATGAVPKATLVNDTTAAAGDVTPGAVAFANTLSAARPGEKFAIIGHLASGTGAVEMITPLGDPMFTSSPKGRFWEHEVVLHNAATAHGTPVGAAFSASWDAWQRDSFNASKMVPIMTQKLVDGTPVAIGDMVVLGGNGDQSFVLHHSMTELYDLTYTKMGFIGTQGERLGATNNLNFSYTLLSEALDASFEAVINGWQSVQADKVNFPEMLDYQWETQGALRGVSTNGGIDWDDKSHFSAEDADGLPYHAQIGANHMLRATGMISFDRPEITNSDWTASHVDVWNPDYDITTQRTLRGTTSPFVRGFVFDGRLITTEAQLVANAGGSGRQGVRITPVGGVDGSEVLQYGRTGMIGLTTAPDDFYAKYVLDLPVMDVGQAKLPAIPVVSRTTFDSNLVGTPAIVFNAAGPSFTDPANIGTISGLTIRGEIKSNGGGTVSQALGTVYKLEILSGGEARVAVSVGGTTISPQTTSQGTFGVGTFVPFVWTVDFVNGTSKMWHGDDGETTFTVTGTPGAVSTTRKIILFSNSFVGEARFLEVWKAATATRDTTALGAAHKRIEADANGDPVQIPILPNW